MNRQTKLCGSLRDGGRREDTLTAQRSIRASDDPDNLVTCVQCVERGNRDLGRAGKDDLH